MPGGILPAPPTGGAFWRDLDFVEIIRAFGDLDREATAGLLQSNLRFASSLRREPFGTAKARCLVSLPLEGGGTALAVTEGVLQK